MGLAPFVTAAVAFVGVGFTAAGASQWDLTSVPAINGSVAYLVEKKGEYGLAIRALEGGHVRLLPWPTWRVPEWSPDGTQFAYVDDRSLAVVSADNGGTLAVARLGPGLGELEWSPDGSLVGVTRSVNCGEEQRAEDVGLHIVSVETGACPVAPSAPDRLSAAQDELRTALFPALVASR